MSSDTWSRPRSSIGLWPGERRLMQNYTVSGQRTPGLAHEVVSSLQSPGPSPPDVCRQYNYWLVFVPAQTRAANI